MKVAVIGAAGYVGGELLRLLDQHPAVVEWTATSRSHGGREIADVHPALSHRPSKRFADSTPAAAAAGCDAVFLCLEHGASSQLAAEVLAVAPLVIDLAADFRIRDPALHHRYYPARAQPANSTSDPDVAAKFVYGLADVCGSDLRGATAIAVPGCFATAAQLALYPLRSVALAVPPVCFAITGSSGAGAQPKPTTHHPVRAHNVFGYALFDHRHEGEVVEQWRAWTGHPDAAIRLLTHSGPFVRGIYLTLHARLAADVSLASGDARSLLDHCYADRPFVRIVNEPPQLTHAVGSNVALLHAALSDDRREVQILVAIDNLLKGAAGQAIQAMNLALGLAETSGLTVAPIFPC